MAASKSSRSNVTTREFVVGIDLDDVEGIVLNRFRVAARGADTCESEVLAANRNDTHHRYREADIGGRLQIVDHRVSAMLILGIDDPSVIDAGITFGYGFRQGIPVARRELRPDSLEYARRRVLQAPRL